MSRRREYVLAAILFVLLLSTAGFVVHTVTSGSCSSACAYTPTPPATAAPYSGSGAAP
jgi:hypothetical protein